MDDLQTSTGGPSDLPSFAPHVESSIVYMSRVDGCCRPGEAVMDRIGQQLCHETSGEVRRRNSTATCSGRLGFHPVLVSTPTGSDGIWIAFCGWMEVWVAAFAHIQLPRLGAIASLGTA